MTIAKSDARKESPRWKASGVFAAVLLAATALMTTTPVPASAASGSTEGASLTPAVTPPATSAAPATSSASTETTTVVIPSTGADLSGKSAVLDAAASASAGVAKVQFVLSGGTFNKSVIGTATPTIFGYAYSWNTTGVPGGTYTLQSLVTDNAANTAYSSGITVTVDNTPPTTAVVIPSSGAALSGTGALLDASAAASYGVGISKVQFVLSGGTFNKSVIGTATPTIFGYAYSWNTTSVPGGTYTLQSLATDAASNTTYSAGITVTVSNITPPTTTVVIPSTGADLSGTSALLDASASAAAGVAKVQFVLSGGTFNKSVIGTATPTIYGYLYSWNTTTVPGGTYTLQSLVTDNAANTAFSPGITVNLASAPSVTSVSPSSGPTGGIARESANFPQNSESLGNNSITISPVKVGDLVILSMQLHASGISISSVSGGNVSSWQRALSYSNSGTDLLYYEVWWGVATATGPSTVSITYSAPVASYPIELIADSFTSGSGLPWTVVAAGGASGAVSTSPTWPSLTSGTSADQLYWGASEEETVGTGGTSPGFTYNVTANLNCFLYNSNLRPNTAYGPSCNETPAAVSTEVGVIFAASGAAATPVTISGTNFAAGDTVSFGGAAASGVTVVSTSTITAKAPRSLTPGTVDVTVTGTSGTSATSAADHFTYVSAPLVPTVTTP